MAIHAKEEREKGFSVTWENFHVKIFKLSYVILETDTISALLSMFT